MCPHVTPVMLLTVCSVLFLLPLGLGQENAGSSVANSLIECYNTTEFLNKDQRLPSTINVLIDLIRKIEDGPTALDARELSIQLIQRFRQDGVIRSERATNSPWSIPFSPRGLQSWKNRIVLQSLVPGNAVTFPNNTLTALERCSLHFMLSNSIDQSIRNDESTVCSRLARYQRRYRRDSDGEDVEVFDPSSGPSKGNLEDDPENVEPLPADATDDVPVDDVVQGDVPDVQDEEDVELLSRNGANLNTISECPVENGVVYTQWGAIQGGTVIAGIAAGYERQLLRTTLNSTFVVDSRYAVTLAGDLSEAALIQGSFGDSITIGAAGGWNSTTVPRWYFVQQRENLEMTDAEIRAGLDGLILGVNIFDTWRAGVPSLRVSQILDMYYSPRGVFNSTIRACNRRNLQTTVAPSSVLNIQTIAFNDLLDDIATLDGTLGPVQRAEVGEKAVSNFLDYLPSNLNDVSCSATGESVIRAATQIIIVLDTAWTYGVIQPALAYLLDNLDVNQFGTNYTLVSGRDFSIIVNSSRTILDFHAQYNLTVHQSYATGFDYIRVFNDFQQLVQEYTDNERTIGGRSTLVLLVPFSTTINENEVTFIRERRNVFRGYVPDIRTLVLGFGPRENYAEAVFFPEFDIFTLSATTDSSAIISAVRPLVNRIKEIPRRIINPACRANWTGGTSSDSLDQYVEPGSINYYRIAPNYFYSDTGDRHLRVRGSGFGPLVVCSSTTVTLPSSNDTDVTCTTINTEEVAFSLNDQCNGHSYISDCPPFFFSVAASNATSVAPSFRCTEIGCRFPDNFKYTVSTNNFGCASSGVRNFAGFLVLAVTIFLMYL